MTLPFVPLVLFIMLVPLVICGCGPSTKSTRKTQEVDAVYIAYHTKIKNLVVGRRTNHWIKFGTSTRGPTGTPTRMGACYKQLEVEVKKALGEEYIDPKWTKAGPTTPSLFYKERPENDTRKLCIEYSKTRLYRIQGEDAGKEIDACRIEENSDADYW